MRKFTRLHVKPLFYSLLDAADITQNDLADKCGINRVTMSRKLTGGAPLLWREVVVICNELSVTNPRDIFEDEGELR